MKSNAVKILLALTIATSSALNAGAQTSSQTKRAKVSSASESMSFIRLDYARTSDAPTELQQALSEAFSSDNKPAMPVSIYLALTNDLNLLRIVGVKNNPDDFGYTHGVEFKVIGDLPNDYGLTLSYTTDLYTTPVEGELSSDPKDNKIKQYFTNENILKLVLTHKPENKMFFWKAEAGWMELDSTARTNYLKGSNQQVAFHNLVNAFSSGTTKDPVLIADGKGDRDGALVGVYMGLAKSFHKDADTCKKTIELQAGIRTSNLPDTTLKSIEARLALDCGFRFTRSRFRIETGYQGVEHSDGMQRQQFFDFSTKRSKWKFGFRVENYSGDLVNYTDYNLPNVQDGTIDPIFKIYTQHDLH